MTATAAQPAIESEVAFPSEDFFAALRDRMNARPEHYQSLGWCDIRLLCVMVADDGLDDDEFYGMAFDTFDCVEARRVLAGGAEAAARDFDADCVLEAYYGTWRDMIESIMINGKAGLEQTLNYLSLPDIPIRAWGPDQERLDKFFRYNQTLQDFFDDASTLEITLR